MQFRRSMVPIVLLISSLVAACRGEGTGGEGEVVEADSVANRPSIEPGPYLLVVNKSGNTLSVVDPGTREAVATIPTGFAPHEVAVSPDGRRAYVTDYGSGSQPGNTLTVVDLEGMVVAATISLAPHSRPHGVDVAADGTVWVTTEGSAHVLQIDPIRGEILQAVETGQNVTHMVAVAETVGRVVTANIGSGTATLVDPAGGTVMAHLETGAGAEGLAVHPDGRRAFVTNRSAGTLTEIDLGSAAIVRTLEVGAFPIRVKVRPGGAELLVSNAEGNELAVVDLASWGVVRRIPVGVMPVGILVTPDGRTAFVANTQDDKITVIDLETWTVQGEVFAGDEPDGMAWGG